jgi:hypothetical protein
MREFLATPAASIVGLLAAIAGSIAVGIYVIGRFRGGGDSDEPAASEMLTNFQELHHRGGLSDEEYRTIKSVLAERLQDELNNTDESG